MKKKSNIGKKIIIIYKERKNGSFSFEAFIFRRSRY